MSMHEYMTESSREVYLPNCVSVINFIRPLTKEEFSIKAFVSNHASLMHQFLMKRSLINPEV